MKQIQVSFIAILLIFSINVQAIPVIGEPTPVTPAKDQGGVGFCWSYSIHAQMESELIRNTGNILNLSEEYLGFYGMFERLKANLAGIHNVASKDCEEIQGDGIVKKKKRKVRSVRDFVVKLTLQALFAPSEGAPNLNEPKGLIKKYGAIPEALFPTKFSKDQAGLESRIGNWVAQSMHCESQVEAYQNDEEKLFQDFAAAFGAKPPKPTDKFTFEGISYTPVTFVSDYLRFNPDEYTELTIRRTDQRKAFEAIERSLKDRRPVQLGYVIFADNFENAKSTGKFDHKTCPSEGCAKPAGGHAVLIVNSEHESYKPDLNSIIIKNSWGQTGVDIYGQKARSEEEKGFYIITDGYLDLAWAQRPTPEPTKENPKPKPPTPLIKEDQSAWSILIHNKYL